MEAPSGTIPLEKACQRELTFLIYDLGRIKITNLFDFIRTIERLTETQNTSETSMKLGPTYPEEQTKIKIKKCIIALYPNTDVISTAVREKVNLIICYTTPLWNFNQITDELYPKVKILLENRIYLYVIPEGWRKSGLPEIISEVLNIEDIDHFRVQKDKHDSESIGRICQTTTPSGNLHNLLSLIKEKLGLPSIRYLGSKDSPVLQIGIIIGQSLTPQHLKLAKRLKIDTILCINLNFDVEKLADDLNISLIDVTAQISNLGLLKLTQVLRMEEPDVDIVFIQIKPSFQIF